MIAEKNGVFFIETENTSVSKKLAMLNISITEEN